MSCPMDDPKVFANFCVWALQLGMDQIIEGRKTPLPSPKFKANVWMWMEAYEGENNASIRNGQMKQLRLVYLAQFHNRALRKFKTLELETEGK